MEECCGEVIWTGEGYPISCQRTHHCDKSTEKHWADLPNKATGGMVHVEWNYYDKPNES